MARPDQSRRLTVRVEDLVGGPYQWLVVVLVSAASALALAVTMGPTQRAVIPTTIGLLVARHKKKTGGDPDELDGDLSAAEARATDASAPGVEPMASLTKALLAAVNDRDVSDLAKDVSDEVAVWVNGIRVDQRPGKSRRPLSEILDSWRRSVPDLAWRVDQEVVGDSGDGLALRITVTGTLTGTDGDIDPTGLAFSYRASVFFITREDRVVEIHQNLDLHDVARQLGQLD